MNANLMEIEYLCVCGKERAWDETLCPDCQQTQSESKGEEQMKKEIGKSVGAVEVVQPAEITRDAIKNKEKSMATQQDQSPAEMIRVAVAGGADLEKLKGLLDLQIQWEANEARKAYHRDMSKFKSIPLKIEKDKKVGFEKKDGSGKVGYSHASLANVVDKITVELGKHGLSASWQTQQNGKIVVTCRITHVLGHSEETSLSADADSSGSKNSIQAIGSTITYLERYTILAALGLATADMDDDGQIAEVVCITDAQLSTLRDMMIAKGIEGKAVKLCGILKVESLETLPAKDYEKAVQLIKDAKGATK